VFYVIVEAGGPPRQPIVLDQLAGSFTKARFCADQHGVSLASPTDAARSQAAMQWFKVDRRRSSSPGRDRVRRRPRNMKRAARELETLRRSGLEVAVEQPETLRTRAVGPVRRYRAEVVAEAVGDLRVIA